MPFTDQLYNINAGIGLYQHIGLGCESSSSSSNYQGNVIVLMFSFCNILAFIFSSSRSGRNKQFFFLG